MVNVIQTLNQAAATALKFDFCVLHDGGFQFRKFNNKMIQYYKGGERSYFYNYPCESMNYKSERRRLIATCTEGCSWRLSATVMQNENSFQIKSLRSDHTCVKNFSSLLMKSQWLSRQYGKYLREYPKTTAAELQSKIHTDFGINVPINRCYRAKRKALRQVQLALRQHYARLYDYAEELCKSNPGTTVVLKSTESEPKRFLRYYVCLDAIKKGWLAGCRPIIGLDGCFLKTICKGELLCAIGRDGNNEMFPIAWAIVENERYDSWAWFLTKLMRYLQSDDGEGWTIMSDQQKGLIQAIKDLMPAAEHRCCARHIYANFRKRHNGVQLRSLFWQAAYSGTKAEFNLVMEEIKGVSVEAFDYLWSREPHLWCRAFFSSCCCAQNVENNMAETFNGYILQARDKPIILMLEDIRIELAVRMQQKKKFLERQADSICPKIRNILEKKKRGHRYWKVKNLGENGFEVRQGLDGYTVKLNEKTCSCRHWQLSGIPCVHAIAAIYCINDNPDNYISEWFLVSKAIKAYDKMIQPVNGEKLWPKSSLPPVLPPIVHVRVGRPKKNRRKEAHEGPERQRINPCELSRKGRKMTCKKCGQMNHNSRGCKNDTVIQPVKEKRVWRCTICRELGHNRNKCHKVNSTAPTPTTPALTAPAQAEVPNSAATSEPIQSPNVFVRKRKSLNAGTSTRFNKTKVPEGYGVFFDEKGQTIEVIGTHGRVADKIPSHVPPPTNTTIIMPDGSQMTTTGLLQRQLNNKKQQLERQRKERNDVLLSQNSINNFGSQPPVTQTQSHHNI